MSNPTPSRDYEESKSFYDCRYFKGYMEDWDSKKKLRVLEIVRELNLPRTGWALDFGCGNGVWADIIKKALPTWEVFGTDISSQAISNAKQRFPHLSFFELSNQREFYEKFDFLFSHHVLEHVFDMNETWNTINRLSKKSASMLHILPCGNSGSLEHRLSLLAKNGIDRRNGRYFFEEPGHLRRLNTEQMNSLAGKCGFHLSRAYYSYHYWATIEGITHTPGFVLEVTNHKRAKNKESEIELKRLRNELLLVTILRFPAVLFENRKNIRRRRSILPVALLNSLLAVLYPFSFPINFYINFKAEREWNLCKNQENGSEMYLFYNRESAPSKPPKLGQARVDAKGKNRKQPKFNSRQTLKKVNKHEITESLSMSESNSYFSARAYLRFCRA